MTHQVKKRKLKKKKKSGPKSVVFRRLLLVLFFAAIVLFSLCTAGYVIFFRTVFARELQPAGNNEIVFEEPDPPTHEVTAVFSERHGGDSGRQLPQVAIIIDDLGYRKKIAMEFLDFPITLSYSFLPYAPFTGKLERIAYYSGKTVLLHLPLEPKGKEWNPGPGTLFLSDSKEVQAIKFEQDLALVPHAVGVNNHMGSLFTSDGTAMKNVLKLIQRNGLFFIDSFTSADSVGIVISRKIGLKSLRRQVFLDNDLDINKICGQLDVLVNLAITNGYGIGIAHPHTATMQALSRCSGKYKEQVRFVSIVKLIDSEKE